MQQLFILLLCALLATACNSKKKNNGPAPLPPLIVKKDSGGQNANPPGSDTLTKTLTLTKPRYYFGDIAHVAFTDVNTKEEVEYEWDPAITAIDEIISICGDSKTCPPLAKRVYTATLQLRLMDVFDFDGEKLVPTGRKEKRWVIAALVNKPQ